MIFSDQYALSKIYNGKGLIRIGDYKSDLELKII